MLGGKLPQACTAPWCTPAPCHLRRGHANPWKCPKQKLSLLGGFNDLSDFFGDVSSIFEIMIPHYIPIHIISYYIYYIYICIYTVFLGGGFSSSRWIASGFSLCGFVWKWGYHSAYFHRNPSLFAISMTGLRSSKMTGSQLSCSVMKTTGAAWRPPIYGNPWLAIRNSNSSYWQSRMKQHMGVIQHSFRWMIGHGFFKLRWPKPLWTLADWSVIVYGKPWVFLWTLEGKAQHKAGVPKDG